MPTQLGFWYEADRLTIDGVYRPAIQFVVQWNGEALAASILEITSHLDMTASLGELLESEAGKHSEDVRAG